VQPTLSGARVRRALLHRCGLWLLPGRRRRADAERAAAAGVWVPERRTCV